MAAKRNAQQEPRKPVGKPFQKGQSGNPKGRSKKQLALQALIRGFAEDTTETSESGNKLVDLAWSLALSGEVGALKLLFEYGYGKPPQKIQITDEGDPSDMTDAQLEDIIRRAQIQNNHAEH